MGLRLVMVHLLGGNVCCFMSFERQTKQFLTTNIHSEIHHVRSRK